MTHTRRGRGRRAAFTLIELLVVIAIIAILVALTAAAVMRALVKGPELQTRTDIGNMDSQMSAAKSNLRVTYVPSHLRLREDNNWSDPNPNSPRAIDLRNTQSFLQAAFGRHFTDSTVNGQPNLIDWNGDPNGVPGNPNYATWVTMVTAPGPGADLLLEGEQVLVFLLGGQAQQGNGSIAMTGFPSQASPGASGKRGPFFEFQGARLRLYPAPDPLNSNQPSLPFPVYIDPWKVGSFAGGQGTPYAFFSSYNPEGNGTYQADCPSLMPNGPYKDPTGKWINASTWQIISAGRNGAFGPGGTFNPATGLVPRGGPGDDDQANFSPRQLGAPAQ